MYPPCGNSAPKTASEVCSAWNRVRFATLVWSVVEGEPTTTTRNGFGNRHTTKGRVQIPGALLKEKREHAESRSSRPAWGDDRVRGIRRVQAAARRGAKSDRGAFLVRGGLLRGERR